MVFLFRSFACARWSLATVTRYAVDLFKLTFLQPFRRCDIFVKGKANRVLLAQRLSATCNVRAEREQKILR